MVVKSLDVVDSVAELLHELLGRGLPLPLLKIAFLNVFIDDFERGFDADLHFKWKRRPVALMLNPSVVLGKEVTDLRMEFVLHRSWLDGTAVL